MWALYASLCIILVIAVYYKYKTCWTREGFAAGTDWFGVTPTIIPINNEYKAYWQNYTLNYYQYTSGIIPTTKSTSEVYPILCSRPVTLTEVPFVVSRYNASVATITQFREAIGSGFSKCTYGFIANSYSNYNRYIRAIGGKLQEMYACRGIGLSAAPDFDNGYAQLVFETAQPTVSVIYAYGPKPPQNEPPRKNGDITMTIGPFNDYVPDWWFQASPPTKHEIFAVYGKVGEIEVQGDLPAQIAAAYKSKLPTIEQVVSSVRTGIMSGTIYPHWTIMGTTGAEGPQGSVRFMRPSSEPEGPPSGPGSSSSSGPAAAATAATAAIQTPKAVLKYELKPLASTPTAPALLLYGPKPTYENREVTIGGRTFTAEFYNTVRNVWSKYDMAVYTCTPSPSINQTSSMTYGEYARKYVSALEVAGNGSSPTTPVKITGAYAENRAYPGCPSTCNACETSQTPYPVRPPPNLNSYKQWKDQPVVSPSKADTPDVLKEGMGVTGTSEPKRSMAIRLVNACRDAGGVVVLSANERKAYDGCPADSWCCSPDTDVRIDLPLAADDPAAATLNKTCEPVEEPCDSELGPAPINTDAYSLTNRRRKAVSQAVKDQFCKPKSASVRTTVQERKSMKLLRRALQN